MITSHLFSLAFPNFFKSAFSKETLLSFLSIFPSSHHSLPRPFPIFIYQIHMTRIIDWLSHNYLRCWVAKKYLLYTDIEKCRFDDDDSSEGQMYHRRYVRRIQFETISRQIHFWFNCCKSFLLECFLQNILLNVTEDFGMTIASKGLRVCQAWQERPWLEFTGLEWQLVPCLKTSLWRWYPVMCGVSLSFLITFSSIQVVILSFNRLVFLLATYFKVRIVNLKIFAIYWFLKQHW